MHKPESDNGGSEHADARQGQAIVQRRGRAKAERECEREAHHGGVCRREL